ncbi:MAG: hypothetical protein JW795_23700 [Chitinivibrionales bacterium]|nr:hypothetical protein [Chitinivibrionales bacterium]
MSQKYHPDAGSTTIITNDLYLAAFLHSMGCTLDHVERNERPRLSFVFCGAQVKELRQAYKSGSVKLNMHSFRDSLLHMRHLMDAALGMYLPTQRGVRKFAVFGGFRVFQKALIDLFSWRKR